MNERNPRLSQDPKRESGPRPNSGWDSERRMRDIEATPFPSHAVQLLDDRARQHANRPFLNFFDDQDVLSYGDVSHLTRRLANGLSSRGIGKGTHVAVMVDTSRTYPLTWLALSRLGAVTIPVNYRYTPRELDFVLRDSQATHLVICSDFLTVLDGISNGAPLPRDNTIVAGNDVTGYVNWQNLFDENEMGRTDQSSPDLDSPMNIQYTSGTTGFPKGAVLSHRYWLTFSRNGAAQFQDRLNRILVSQPFYYVDAQWLTLMACWTGATAFVARQMHSSRILGWMREHRLEYCNFPEIVARQPAREDDFLPDLVAMSCYSHRPENFPLYEKRYGGAARQGFSMTELGCVLYVPMEAKEMTGSGTVGIPVAFREIDIRDSAGRSVADGQSGEICVRGPGIFQGYFNNPEATTKAFHKGGWFRTGDLGRCNAEGWFWYLGRQKDMVRRSNENISAVEVEQILRGVAEVLESAVVPVPDTTRGEEVKAYLILVPGTATGPELISKIFSHCDENLAPYKIPRYLEFINEFPRTPSQKIKKSDLLSDKDDLTTGAWDRVQNQWN